MCKHALRLICYTFSGILTMRLADQVPQRSAAKFLIGEESATAKRTNDAAIMPENLPAGH